MASVEIINPAQIDSGEPIEIQLSMSNIVYRGPAGPQGPKGEDGRPGVWVGETAPEDGYYIWIDPSGDGADALVQSVNGKTGVVVLNAEDVGALSEDTELQRFELLSNTEILDIWNNM